MKLLIVDDKKAALEMLEDYFAPRGWEVLCAERAAEGLRIAHDERPDIVILDLRLPDCPGDEVLRQIKTYLPEIKVIIVTGEDDEKLKEKVQGYGCDAYFEKANLSLAELGGAVRDLLS